MLKYLSVVPPEIFDCFTSEMFRSGGEKPLAEKPSIIVVDVIVALEASIGWFAPLTGMLAI